MRKFLKEFKEFIATGNMLELAVAVILASAVSAVIEAFTNGIVMQVIAAVFGKPDFEDVTITLRNDVSVDPDTGLKTVDAVLQVGTFVNTLITLMLTGFALFVMVQAYNRMRRRARAEPVTDPGPTQIELLTEIRDALRDQNRQQR